MHTGGEQRRVTDPGGGDARDHGGDRPLAGPVRPPRPVAVAPDVQQAARSMEGVHNGGVLSGGQEVCT